jgi:signal transduction histidine kinase
MKIKNRFLLVFVVVTVITASVLVVAFDNYRSDIETEVDDTLAERATTASNLLDNRLEGYKETVRVGAANPDLRRHGQPTQRPALARFVERSPFSGASVLDADGRMVEHVGENGTDDEATAETIIGESFAGRAYVQRALAGETSISEPFQPPTGNEIIVVSTPLYDDQGDIVGVLTAAYYLEETTLFEPLAGTNDAIGITVSTSDRTLYSTAERFDASETTTRTVDTTGWQVTSHYDEAAITAELRQLAVIQFLIGISVIGTITGFGIWVYQAEIRHTERLHRRIENLKRRTYTDDVEFGGATEWREIGSALDRLSTALASREQMLLVINRFLRHNLRNELNVVAGYAATLQQTADDPETARQVNQIQTSADRVLSTAERVRLTETLIDPVDPDVCRELIAVLDEQIQQVRTEYPSVTLDLVAPETAWAACGETMEVAIYELLCNVAVHAGDDPRATVSVTTDAESVTVSIVDTGPGIPAGEAALLCGSADITPLTHSSGFGLWLVNWIVTRHGGELRIPDTEGGTTVVLTLPRADPGPSAGRRSTVDGSPAGSGRSDTDSDTGGGVDTDEAADADAERSE